MVSVEGRKPPRLFGTNGIRGFPNQDLSAEFCVKVGKSIATYCKGSTIAMGRDTRSTGDFVFSSVLAGLLSIGSNVLDLGVLPTPAVQYYCKTKKIFGVVITASHNPPEFNGIKSVDSDGTELDRSEEEKIEEIFQKENFKPVVWNSIGRVRGLNDAMNHYVDGILSRVDVDNIRRKEFRVLVDVGNGASYQSTPFLLESLNCKVVSLNANPDGKFTSRNSEPKPANLTDLISLMKTGNFSLGIAHDGDADRAVFIDEKGEFIDGDKTLTLVVENVVGRNDKVVTPVSSSDAIEEICRKKGAELIRTKVGAPIVSRTMIQEKAKIGGEENGGVIFGEHQYCRDGAMTVALVLNLMAKTGMPISSLIAKLPAYTIVKKEAHLRMDWGKLLSALSNRREVDKADFTDGIKILREDGWILIRPSGTEPIVRIYGHSRSPEIAEKYSGEFVSIVAEIQGHT